MADLSDLLGDVYGPVQPADPDGPPVPHEPPASDRVPVVPDWASDERLDEAFKDWTPGSTVDAPETEDEKAETLSIDPVEALDIPEAEPLPEPGKRLDDDLAAALSAALADAPRTPAPASETAGTAASLFWGMNELAPAMAAPEATVAPVAVPAAPVSTEAAVAEAKPVESPDEIWARWRRDDDDILPKRRRRLRFFRR